MAISTSDFDYLRQLIAQNSAISLDPCSAYLAESRLAHLAMKEGKPSVGAFLSDIRLRPFGEVHRNVLDAMTNNETWFFRDLHPFEMLRRKLLPDLIAARRDVRRLHIWSAACSSGQEAYSLAMLLEDDFPELRSWAIKILGTDISSAILNRARSGRYSQMEVNRGLPAAMLSRHFRREGLEWIVKDSLKTRVEFQALNLAKPWQSIPPVDIVLLRNVLIYFEVPVKRQILAQVRTILRPDGFLLLGCAESTINLDDHFERVPYEKTACYRLRS